jgi:hypothetical protein
MAYRRRRKQAGGSPRRRIGDIMCTALRDPPGVTVALTPTIADLVRTHDDDPQAAAQALRSLAQSAIADDDLQRYTWLVNHVIGEKLGDWPNALSLQRQVGDGREHRAALRNTAIAASMAGDALAGLVAEARFADVAAVSPAQAAMSVRLGMLQYAVSDAPTEHAAVALNHCVREIDAWPGLGPLADQFAAALNNIVSALLDRSDADAANPVTRAALREGSKLARRAWSEAGTWVNVERADYLVAMCLNKIGDWQAAADAARSGLDTIARNGTEDVDRAFLLLELGKACRELGLGDEASSATAQASSLAKQFAEPALREWFESRVAATR